MPGSETVLWQFALQLYEQEGVKPWLLEMQDHAAADVCLLLGLIWLGSQGLRLDDDQHSALAGSVLGWQQRVTARLRSRRRAVRRGGFLYRQLLRMELLAERRALQQLARQADGWLTGGATMPGAFDRDAAMANVERYLNNLSHLEAGRCATVLAQLRALLPGPDALH